MDLLAIAYILPFIGTTLITLTSAYYLNIQFEKTRIIKILTVILILLSLWVSSYGAELWIKTLSHSILLDKIAFANVCLLPVAWMIFALEYTGRSEMVNKKNITLLLIIPIICIILIWTNSYHGLFFKGITTKIIGPLNSILYNQRGIGFWIYGGYGYSLLFGGTFLIAFRLVSLGRIYLKQAIILLTAFTAPALGNLAYNLWLYQYPIYNPTPILLTIALLIAGWNVIRFRFLDIMPMARTTILEKIEDSIIIVDKQDRIVDLNESAEKFLKVFTNNPNEKIGLKIENVLPSKIDLKEKDVDYESGVEIELPRNDESSFFEIRKVPFQSAENKYIGKALILRDITSRKKAEEKEEFLHSLLRHDIGNKLQVARGHLELTLEETKLSEKEKKRIKNSLKALEEGGELIEKVRLLRQVTEENIEEVNADSIMSEVIEELKPQAKNKNIEIQYEPCDFNVRGGPLLKELFSNLIENSIKHSNCQKIRIYGQKKATDYNIIIEDDGRGIPQEEREKIFKKGYKKGKSAGSGLGMYLVKKIAENYNGNVAIEDSELGGVKIITRLKR